MEVISYEGAEPVSVAEAKAAARVDDDLPGGSSLDGIIAGHIAAAREHAEHLTGRCYRKQTRRVERRNWPLACEVLPIGGVSACAVKYWNGAQFVDLADGVADFAPGGNGTLLAPASGQVWPTLSERTIGPRVRIDLTADPAATMPAQVKTYILAVVCAWLKTPEAQASGALTPNPLFARLLDRECLYG